VYAGTLIAFVLLVSAALWLPHRRGASGSAMDFGLFLLTVTIASPIAWTHHYGVVLPILAVTAPAMLALAPWGRATAPALAVGYVLVSQYIAPLNASANVWGGIGQSYVLGGALVILALLYASLRPPAGCATPAPP
jgi:hypothetical protein